MGMYQRGMKAFQKSFCIADPIASGEGQVPKLKVANIGWTSVEMVLMTARINKSTEAKGQLRRM
jgi:hypothetical protein